MKYYESFLREMFWVYNKVETDEELAICLDKIMRSASAVLPSYEWWELWSEGFELISEFTGGVVILGG